MPKKLKKGDKAPPFQLTDKDGVEHSLASLPGDFAVVYFYPKDNTPGYANEAKGFSLALPRFKKLKTEIVGISGGTDETKANFCAAHKLRVTLLSDPEFEVSKRYGAFGKKTMMGYSYMGIYRKTFLLDKGRKIIKIYDKVTPVDHAQEIERDIKLLNAENA